MPTEDEILEFLDEGDRELIEQEDPALPNLAAVVSAIAYVIALPQEDTDAVTEQKKWTHLEGVLYRRRCHGVGHEPSEGLLTFSISVGEANIDDVVQAIAEELDEITGRKLEKAGAEAWGMF